MDGIVTLAWPFYFTAQKTKTMVTSEDTKQFALRLRRSSKETKFLLLPMNAIPLTTKIHVSSILKIFWKPKTVI